MKAVSILFTALLIAEAVFVAPARAYSLVFPSGRPPADPTFLRFGSFSLDCEQQGTTRRIRIDIEMGSEAQKGVPTISFIEGDNVRLRRQILQYLAVPDQTVDRFGQNPKWVLTLKTVLWNDGRLLNDGSYLLSTLDYDDETGRWRMFIETPGHNIAALWLCLGNQPAYDCTLKGVGYSEHCDAAPPP